MRISVCALSIFFLSLQLQAFDLPEVLRLEKMNTQKIVDFEYKKFHQTTILFFWASWCDRCKEILPDILEIQSKMKGVKIVGISVDDDKTKALSGLKSKYSAISRQFWSEAKILDDLKIKLIPLIILVNKNGIIDTVYEGSYSDKISYFKKRVHYLENGD
jgi:thiol-disulfide isomerase/thioredoxin